MGVHYSESKNCILLLQNVSSNLMGFNVVLNSPYNRYVSHFLKTRTHCLNVGHNGWLCEDCYYFVFPPECWSEAKIECVRKGQRGIKENYVIGWIIHVGLIGSYRWSMGRHAHRWRRHAVKKFGFYLFKQTLITMFKLFPSRYFIVTWWFICLFNFYPSCCQELNQVNEKLQQEVDDKVQLSFEHKQW